MKQHEGITIYTMSKKLEAALTYFHWCNRSNTYHGEEWDKVARRYMVWVMAVCAQVPHGYRTNQIASGAGIFSEKLTVNEYMFAICESWSKRWPNSPLPADLKQIKLSDYE